MGGEARGSSSGEEGGQNSGARRGMHHSAHAPGRLVRPARLFSVLLRGRRPWAGGRVTKLDARMGLEGPDDGRGRREYDAIKLDAQEARQARFVSRIGADASDLPNYCSCLASLALYQRLNRLGLVHNKYSSPAPSRCSFPIHRRPPH